MRWFFIAATLAAAIGATGCSDDFYFTGEVREACKAHADGSQEFKDCAFNFWRDAHAKLRPSPGH